MIKVNTYSFLFIYMHYPIYKQVGIEVLMETWSKDPENYEVIYMYNCIIKMLYGWTLIVETSLA